MKGLTAKQAFTLEAIVGHTQLRGHPPALATLARWMGVTKTAVHDRCLALVKKGYLTRAPGAPAFAFRLTPQAQDWFQAGAQAIHFPTLSAAVGYADTDTQEAPDGHYSDAP